MERNSIDEMVKICQAVKDGKEIEFYGEVSREWRIALLPPNFREFRYRIKTEEEETLLTNRELSRWLAQGNGEVSMDAWNDTTTYWNYCKENANEVCDYCIRIRKWDDTEWHKPTKEYCFGEEDA